MMRFVLAATLSSNYGIYGPAFEQCVNEPMENNGKSEEYLHSEKYEIKDWKEEGNIQEFIGKINKIRKENLEFQTTYNLTFYEINNNDLLAYGKGARGHRIIIVVNLKPEQPRFGMLRLPLADMGIAPDQSFVVRDLITDVKYTWKGESNYVELLPDRAPAHIFRIE